MDGWPIRYARMQKAEVIEVGEGGRLRSADHSWGLKLENGDSISGYLTAKINSLKHPALQVGQWVNVYNVDSNSKRCSIEVGSFTFI